MFNVVEQWRRTSTQDGVYVAHPTEIHFLLKNEVMLLVPDADLAKALAFAVCEEALTCRETVKNSLVQ